MAGPAEEVKKLEDLTPTVSGAAGQEEEEEADANSSFATDASSDGDDDDVEAEALNFQKILATARRRGGDKAADQSVISITSGGGGVDESPAAANTPTKGDGQANLIQKLLDEVQSLRTEHANFRQQASIAEVFSKTSDKMMEVVNSNKRERGEKKEMPEDPILEVWSPRDEKAVDDNHNKYAWAVRRMVKQPNADPKNYWDQAKYKMQIKPNLREGLFLQHLMPLGLSAKALGWGHDLCATTAIKYYTHHKAVNGRKRKSNFSVEEDRENMESRIVTVGQEWAEASSLHELAEAVHNWAAVRFMCAPWDWSGLLLLRVLHEASYFSTAADGEGPQRAHTEKYIDEYLGKNRRNLMQGKPPMDYKRAMGLADEVVRSFNGKHDRLWNNTDLYSSYRQAQAGAGVQV